MVAALGYWDITEPMRRLAHRGIRSKVVQSYAGVVGHVRLPIVGLGEDHDQPMQKNYTTIGFVGELLDFREKNPEYECDSELVRDLWHAVGPYGFVDRDGFWGIVCIDDRTKTLHVLTDYLAQKPMYYRTDYPSAASEIDALIPFGPVTPDLVYLSAVMKWGYCPEIIRTPWQEIHHVVPGEHVALKHDTPPRRTIVDQLIVDTSTISLPKLAHELEMAVKRRVLSSDVQTACLVSGGVDSAIVYTLAARYGTPVPYFVSEQNADPDYWKALQVVNGSVHDFSAGNNLPPTPTFPLHRSYYHNIGIEGALAIMQEPIDLGSLRPQIALSHTVRERVCLTGDGADELFGGYSRSLRYDSQYSDVFHELPAWHLPRLDRVMMHQQIEVRSPFLARRVAEIALGLPHGLRQNKNFLRSIARGILPPRIADEPKKALRAPEIEHDREGYSQKLVTLFKEMHA